MSEVANLSAPEGVFKVCGFVCGDCKRLIYMKNTLEKPYFCSHCGVRLDWNSAEKTLKGAKYNLEW